MLPEMHQQLRIWNELSATTTHLPTTQSPMAATISARRDRFSGVAALLSRPMVEERV